MTLSNDSPTVCKYALYRYAPSAAAGTVVSGDLYVDDLETGVPPYGQQTGDELAAIPYEYTVGS